MTNCRDIIDAAYSRSTFNDPDKLATDAELVGVIDRRFKQLYSKAARFNPVYFGKSTTVAAGGANWPWPADAELIFKVESLGELVRVVPIEDLNADIKPSVYQMGRAYLTTDTTELNPATASLTLLYSRRPADLDTTLAPEHATNTLDSTWPEQFNDLIVLHLAKYLSVKDSRDGGEIQALDAEEQSLMGDFARHLGHSNYAMRARYGQRARMVSQMFQEFQGGGGG